MTVSLRAEIFNEKYDKDIREEAYMDCLSRYGFN